MLCVLWTPHPLQAETRARSLWIWDLALIAWSISSDVIWLMEGHLQREVAERGERQHVVWGCSRDRGAAVRNGLIPDLLVATPFLTVGFPSVPGHILAPAC